MTCLQIAFSIAYLAMYKTLQSSLYENKEGAIKGTSHLTVKPVHSFLNDTSKSENDIKLKSGMLKEKVDLYFSIVHISTNNVLGSLKCCKHQISDCSLVSYFKLKNG